MSFLVVVLGLECWRRRSADRNRVILDRASTWQTGEINQSIKSSQGSLSQFPIPEQNLKAYVHYPGLGESCAPDPANTIISWKYVIFIILTSCALYPDSGEIHGDVDKYRSNCMSTRSALKHKVPDAYRKGDFNQHPSNVSRGNVRGGSDNLGMTETNLLQGRSHLRMAICSSHHWPAVGIMKVI